SVPFVVSGDELPMQFTQRFLIHWVTFGLLCPTRCRSQKDHDRYSPSHGVSSLGSGQANSWTLVNGPRLRAGIGPDAVAVAEVYRNGVPDILVANSLSNNVYLIPGVGGGFCDDAHPVDADMSTAVEEELSLIRSENENELAPVTFLVYASGWSGIEQNWGDE